MHCDTMRRNPLKNKKKMRISFQPVDNPDKVNTHLLSWLLAACSMIGPFATDMYLPSFHQMAQAFGSDLAGVQMTLSSYLAGFAVMTLFYGTISDMFGRKLTMVTGFLCFSASSLGAATSDSLSMLVAFVSRHFCRLRHGDRHGHHPRPFRRAKSTDADGLRIHGLRFRPGSSPGHRRCCRHPPFLGKSLLYFDPHQRSSCSSLSHFSA